MGGKGSGRAGGGKPQRRGDSRHSGDPDYLSRLRGRRCHDFVREEKGGKWGGDGESPSSLLVQGNIFRPLGRRS